MSTAWGIHWFRRDLRVSGNAALRANWKRHQGRVLGLFCFDAKFLSREDFSHNRFAFFLKTMSELRRELRAQGGDLLVVDGLPKDVFPRLLEFCAKSGGGRPGLVSFCRDYEPFARGRDREIEALLKTLGVETHTERDHLLFEPHEVMKSETDPYQVYSPYARRWFEALGSEEGQRRVREHERSAKYFSRAQSGAWERVFEMTWDEFLKHPEFPFRDAFEEFEKKNAAHVTVPLPQAGFLAAYAQVQGFANRVDAYKERRDFPAIEGTSKLSVYFKNGSIVSSQVIEALGLKDQDWRGKGGPTHFVKEIAWREFYYAILFHRPDVEHASFLPQYRELAWENNPAWFERWKEGTTGFPIVDAGMRELRQTGWMHNRVRMIVASFLTKDLLISWQWGENWFMRQLLDGDLAPNNGGWQWAASTGCDPQPYFRIFNPWLQSKKFDPEGTYIRRYVPELREASAAELHDAEADRSRYRYPAPIVRHEVQRDKALMLYKVPPP